MEVKSHPSELDTFIPLQQSIAMMKYIGTGSVEANMGVKIHQENKPGMSLSDFVELAAKTRFLAGWGLDVDFDKAATAQLLILMPFQRRFCQAAQKYYRLSRRLRLQPCHPKQYFHPLYCHIQQILIWHWSLSSFLATEVLKPFCSCVCPLRLIHGRVGKFRLLFFCYSEVYQHITVDIARRFIGPGQM